MFLFMLHARAWNKTEKKVKQARYSKEVSSATVHTYSIATEHTHSFNCFSAQAQDGETIA